MSLFKKSRTVAIPPPTSYDQTYLYQVSSGVFTSGPYGYQDKPLQMRIELLEGKVTELDYLKSTNDALWGRISALEERLEKLVDHLGVKDGFENKK